MSTVNRKTDRSLLSGVVAIAATLVFGVVTAGAEEPNRAGGQLQLSRADAEFARQAAKGGRAEVLEARLAQEKAENDRVKEAAKQLEQDHTTANEKLRRIMDARGAKLPTDPPEDRKATLEKLKQQDGRAFDREYLRAQVAAHKKTIALFEKQAKEGENAQLKAFASSQLPTLRHHLEMMQELERTHTASK